MAIRSRNVLKAFFATGKFPTAAQFADVFDSFFHKSEDAPNVISFVDPPASVPNSPGTKGQIAYDADYLYICIANGQWKKTILSE